MKPTISQLLGVAEHSSPNISADGERVCFIGPLDGVLNIFEGPLGGPYEPVTKSIDRPISNCFWTAAGNILYLLDNNGDENLRLYEIAPSGGDPTDLTPFPGIRVELVGGSLNNCLDEVLLSINKKDPRLHDVYRLRISDRTLEMVEENSGNVSAPAPTRSAWTADQSGAVRGRTVVLDSGVVQVQVRDSGRGEWRTVREWTLDDTRNSYVHGFDKEGNFYLVDSAESNAGRLICLSPDGSFRVILEDDQYDVGGVFSDPLTRVPVGATIVRERRHWSAIDPEFKLDLDAISSAIDGDFEIVSTSKAGRWILADVSGDRPVRFHTYDRNRKTVELLFGSRPELENAQFRALEPINFAARDGLVLHGYLTRPEGKGPHPMVLTPHGGPWGRDAWMFNPTAQWLSGLGFAVLQINFRGSTGYGKDFLNAGNREWGGRMHDDLIDGVNWAVEQGVADRDRLACFGASYGGYATLIAATFTPEVFACHVAVCGFTNIITSLKNSPPYWKPRAAQWFYRAGNPYTEEEFCWSRSPLSRVGDIRRPLMIVQGAMDVRVPVGEAEQLVAALKERNIEHEYILFPDEGHGFTKQANRMKFYEKAEAFLLKHLKGE